MPTCDRDRLGRYEILAELGRGAMGTVYKARDPKIDRLVAIKTISVENSQGNGLAEFRERFFREARAAGRLSHPGIVTIYDVDEDSEAGPFIVMEYVEGHTLDQLLAAESEPVSSRMALDLAEQLAEALHYAHTQGIVHRDIKPANIIVTETGRAKITDFGIAKLDLTQLTATGHVFGTPSYMSPEQIEGEEVDARSDLFSLGVVLYSMLTGYKPFQGNSAATISYKLVYKDPVPVTALNAALPIHCDYVVSRALAKMPAQRYQTGQKMAEDLQDIQAGVAPRSLAEHATHAAAEQTRIQPAMRTGTIRSERGLGRRVGRQWYGVFSGKKALWLGFAIVLVLCSGVLYRLRQVSATPSPAINRAADMNRPPDVASSAPLAPAPQAVSVQPLVPVATSASSTASRKPPLAAAKSPLDIAVQSPFTSATLSIWVDDKMAYEHEMSGQSRKRMWVVRTVEGNFSSTMSVPAGSHLLRVQVASEGDHYLGVVRVEGEFVKQTRKTLTVTFHGRDHEMSAQLN
jgi:serine/threonine-protein kinase